MKKKNIYFLKAADKVPTGVKPLINLAFRKSFPNGIECETLEEAKEITVSKFSDKLGKDFNIDALALDFIGHIPIK